VSELARVALVSPYALSVPGGVQTQVRATALELAARGLDVTVCSPGAIDDALVGGGVAHAAVGRVLSVRANGSRAPITLSARAARSFASIAATLRDGVVHVHEPFAPIASWALLREHRRATVGTFHRGGGGPAYLAGRPVIARLSAGLDVTAAVSERAAATISANSALRPVVLFNGIDVEALASAVPRRTEAPTVVFVGRHEERKGLGVLLEAFGTLALPVRLWVVGAGPLTESLRARHAGDLRVEWLGALSDAEMRSALRGADVLCVPSLGGESFGLVPLEGMAAGTAVVASDIAGYREATAGHARLVAPGDATALALALAEALAHPLPRREVVAAREHARGWSVAALVDRYLALYEQARERHGPEGPGAAGTGAGSDNR
jgi:phosphatidylinositol alpha-mannosyltransferase